MTDALRPPGTTWEFCLSAADELVLWHVRQGEDVPEDDRPRVVVVIAAAVYGLAVSISVEGPRIAGLPLTGPGGTANVHGILRYHALSALQACPDEALGAAEREQLLASYGSRSFDLVRDAAVTVVAHHARSSEAAGQPHPTIQDRAPAMARSLPDAIPIDVDEARQRQQYLKAGGVIWVVYDDGLSRLPVMCGRCQARTGLTLRIDAEAGQIRVVCPDHHITRDPRLTVDAAQKAISLRASRSGDVEINGGP